MKEKILENFLKLLARYNSYNVSLIEGGKYHIYNILSINGASHYSTDIVINIRELAISYAKRRNFWYDESGANSTNLIWSDHIDNIIEQLKPHVQSLLDRIIKDEDNERAAKSRACRAGRRLKQLMEVTA